MNAFSSIRKNLFELLKVFGIKKRKLEIFAKSGKYSKDKPAKSGKNIKNKPIKSGKGTKNEPAKSGEIKSIPLYAVFCIK